MANIVTLKDLDEWIQRDFGRRGSPERKVKDTTIEWIEKHNQEFPESQQYSQDFYRRIQIFTFTNRYTISAHQRDDGGYLGCTSSCRKHRTGETWFRGNDLPDGKLTEETWSDIIRGIISYELEDIVITKVGIVPDNSED